MDLYKKAEKLVVIKKRKYVDFFEIVEYNDNREMKK